MSLRSRLTCLLAAGLLLTPLLPATAAPPAHPRSPVPQNLKANNLTNLLGIAPGAPRLSWQLDGSRRGTSQTRYEIRVQHNATASGYDPSLVDVWSLPMP
ncbi:hypothetical protein [Kribbella sp. VKM Ac-2568]|uniref:glycoside hydrolase family 78 protein n=1 Tax=Kribbella sp. VKM Ac-2568 TaxID=2512219 RepID=UPI0010E7327D|nr:hypothetical protein [Kribbella sp. VKM Ac-2568]TCM49405.1 hypothetical protein EV648_103680 [Kribbella sp. VKM Ac-2568]